MKESKVQDIARVALSRAGAVLWRNNVGTAEHWTPRGVQRVRYGLAEGSSDLVGLIDGRFVAVEVKAHDGRVSEEQEQFLALVRRAGGFATVLRGPAGDDATDVTRACFDIVARARAGASE